VKRAIVLAILLATSVAYADAEEHETGAAAEEHEHGGGVPYVNYTNFDYRGKTTPEGEPVSPPFVLLLANFAVLVILLAKFGRPAARQLAEERHDQIKKALDEAKQLRDEAAKKLADYEGRIKSLDGDIQKLVDGIKADAEADKARIVAAAEAQSVQMKRDAELRIAAEIETARAQLQQEVSLAAAAATEKLLRDKTTPDDQSRLVKSFIEGMH
jgi:F-type H+-transporting ATPase subunit b